MELENLKTAWTSVDERLEKKEILSSEMVKEMLKKKSNKLLRSMKWGEIIGMIIGLPLFIYIWLPNIKRSFSGEMLTDFWGIIGTILVSALFIMIIAGIVIEICAFKNYLLKIDLSKKLKDNIHYVNMYGIAQRKSWVIFRFWGIPLLLLFVVMFFRDPEHANSAIALFFVLAFLWLLVSLLAYWAYRGYNKYIQRLKDNLAELHELEE